MTCTGISASWCPIHGDCLCPRNEYGETVSDDDPNVLAKDSARCPLHAPWSNHGEQEFAETVWGTMEVGEQP